MMAIDSLGSSASRFKISSSTGCSSLLALDLLEDFEHRFLATPAFANRARVDHPPMIKRVVVLQSNPVPPPMICPKLLAPKRGQFQIPTFSVALDHLFPSLLPLYIG
jgi:hypothetical protein